MGRRKTPQLKKQQSYAHDRVEGGEYPHAHRKNRPLVKALGKRQLRKRANQLLATSPQSDSPVLPTRPVKGWRNTSQPLPQHLDATQRRRVEIEAINILKRSYNQQRHERFRRALLSWMEGGVTERSAAVGRFWQELLHPPEPGLHRQYFELRRDFARRFFAAEPELLARFEEWIARQLSEENAG